jgi:hypothetical protein
MPGGAADIGELLKLMSARAKTPRTRKCVGHQYPVFCDPNYGGAGKDCMKE